MNHSNADFNDFLVATILADLFDFTFLKLELSYVTFLVFGKDVIVS